MAKRSKFDRQKILAAIIECRNAGMNHIEAGIKLGMPKSSIATYSCRYGITGWPQGAAARDQRGSRTRTR